VGEVLTSFGQFSGDSKKFTEYWSMALDLVEVIGESGFAIEEGNECVAAFDFLEQVKIVMFFSEKLSRDICEAVLANALANVRILKQNLGILYSKSLQGMS
jgi:hypothetical protein